MQDHTTRIIALQHARAWAVSAEEIALLDEEIKRLQAERRSEARAVPGFATRTTDH